MNETKKICFYIGSLSRGGAERVILNVAEYARRSGYQATVVTKLQEKEEYPVPEGVKRILADICGEEVSKSRIVNFFRRLSKLRRIWKSEKPDVLVSFIGKNNFMAIVSALGLKSRVVVSVRNDPENEYPTGIMRLLAKNLFRLADGIVLQTRQVFSFFPAGVQRKAVLLLNPLSREFMRTPFAGDRKKEIVTVGRLHGDKNQNMLVRAFAAIADEFPEWNCVFYGDGEEAQRVKACIEENGLTERITMMGRVPDVSERIRESAVFVLPSKVEGMPNALMEAMALGCAVISTDCPCGGPADLIKSGENGILIPVDDETALADALSRLLSDEALRARLGGEAAKIQGRADQDKINGEWLTYLEKIMGV